MKYPILFYSQKYDTPIILYPNNSIEFLFCDVKMKWFKSSTIQMIKEKAFLIGEIK